MNSKRINSPQKNKIFRVFFRIFFDFLPTLEADNLLKSRETFFRYYLLKEERFSGKKKKDFCEINTFSFNAVRRKPVLHELRTLSFIAKQLSLIVRNYEKNKWTSWKTSNSIVSDRTWNIFEKMYSAISVLKSYIWIWNGRFTMARMLIFGFHMPKQHPLIRSHETAPKLLLSLGRWSDDSVRQSRTALLQKYRS